MGRILPGPRGQVHRSGRLQLKALCYGGQETLHLESEHWKNTLEIITSMLRHEAYHGLYFLTVARGPTMSQSDRLI